MSFILSLLVGVEIVKYIIDYSTKKVSRLEFDSFLLYKTKIEMLILINMKII